ncbi:hypothetical protein [Methylophilus aquaticus]|uniref:GspL cytoplasmic actin-ATPase-like domain-containing protein n=1 Tax=Methylophilus aquaticus TaxID=1971610 RepID=A0ABT9JQS8_9PROT|nr:hypothetical protein [Methylophilus aquaticus]MDP8566903.1 hypothetical protein [Methylophilus aquaticus]
MLHHYPDPGIDSTPSDSRYWWRAWTQPELRVVVCANGIEVFLSSRDWRQGWQPVLLARQPIPCTAQQTGFWPEEVVWTTLAQILAHLPVFMQSQTRRSGLHVVVIVSNQFVRWLVAPWQGDVLRKSEREAYCLHLMQQHFGESMQDWQISSQPARYGEHALLNALPPGLVARLQALFAEHGLSLGAIYPAWMLSANQALHGIRQQRLPESGWVICRESNGLTIACLQQGQWLSINTLPLASEPQWPSVVQHSLLRAQVLYPERQLVNVLVAEADAPEVHEVLGEAFHVIGLSTHTRSGTEVRMPLRKRAA